MSKNKKEIDNLEESENQLGLNNSFTDRVRRRLIRVSTDFWFRILVKRFTLKVNEIGAGDFSFFVEEQRYKPRAQYLIKNQWTIIQYGIYLIEYTIVDRTAFSYLSLNQGLDYSLHMETELTKNHASNMEIIVELFKRTEEFAHWTITIGKSPYFRS
jgi:hypothetical protein